MLSLRDKAAIATGLMRFLRGYPADDTESFASWLKRTGQTDRAIRHFWEPVVVGALNDGFDRCSVKYAGKVFHESFLRSPEAGRLGIPAAPLSDFFAPVADLAQPSGRHSQAQIRSRPHRATPRQPLADPRRRPTSTQPTPSSWPPTSTNRQALTAYYDRAARQPNLRPTSSPPPSPPSTSGTTATSPDLDHAVLLDTRIQWVFVKSRIRRWPAERGSYLELVISASWPELEMSREAILASALTRVRNLLPRRQAGKAPQNRRPQRSPRHLLRHPRPRPLPPPADNPNARPLPRRRLDRHRMALHHGGRRPQRPPRRRSLSRRCKSLYGRGGFRYRSYAVSLLRNLLD